LFIEIVSVTKDRFVFVAGVNDAHDEFVMLGVVTSFDVRLRIDVLTGRPIGESE
jgi:hypothetical protein